jgi:hypothetical protein
MHVLIELLKLVMMEIMTSVYHRRNIIKWKKTESKEVNVKKHMEHDIVIVNSISKEYILTLPYHL